MPEIKVVLFDLDGTLLDTVRTFFIIVNHILEKNNFSRLPDAYFETFRLKANSGKEAIETAFNYHEAFCSKADEEKTAIIEDALRNFLAEYEKRTAEGTVFFEGTPEVLNDLNERGIPFLLVTNKPRRFTDRLLDHFPLLQGKIVVCGDDQFGVPPAKLPGKPAKDPLLKALELYRAENPTAQFTPENCVYIGDSATDIVAANRAGMLSIAARWGYGDDPTRWSEGRYGEEARASYIVNSARELHEWLAAQSSTQVLEGSGRAVISELWRRQQSATVPEGTVSPAAVPC